MKRRTVIRIVSFNLALVFVVVGIYTSVNHKAQQYKLHIKYVYESALETLSVNIGNIENALKKSVYVSSQGQFTNLAVLLSRESAAAKSAIASLPADSGQLTTVNKFLSQVGEYSLSLSKKAASGGEINNDDRTTLHNLSSVAGKIHSGIDDIYTSYASSGLWDEEIDSSDTQIEGGNFSDDIHQIEQSLTDYPSLIYDGPFSDHINTENSELLENSGEISYDEAKQIAAKALSVSVDDLMQGNDEEGNMPSYGFKTDDNCSVSVTKAGGYVVYLRRYLPESETKFSFEQARDKAMMFLEDIGYKNMQSNYYFTTEGVCIINFAYLNGATVCYTDLIKVGVDISSGNVVLLEARGYIQNHKNRNIVTPKYSEQQAGQILSDTLKVQTVSLALIPTQSGDEAHCYEFLCTGINDEEVLVYVNTATLTEEQIFILLKTDGGVLTK